MPHLRELPPLSAAVLALALLGGLEAGAGAEPILTVERAAGGPGLHAVSTIQALTFAPDTLVVTETGGQESAYPLATVTRVWFDSGAPPTSAPTSPAAAAAIVQALHLLQNRPNPASLSTSIEFDVPTRGPVSLVIHDVTGARVRTLTDDILDPGTHTVTWDGKSDAGTRVASGAYFYRLRADGIDESRRLVYLR